MGILLYPFAVLFFWYKEGLFSILAFLGSLNDYVLRLFSLPGLFSTYFRPLKNEYRKNLILFSIIFGIFIKTLLIVASLSIFSIILIVEMLILVMYLLFPLIPVILFIA